MPKKKAISVTRPQPITPQEKKVLGKILAKARAYKAYYEAKGIHAPVRKR